MLLQRFLENSAAGRPDKVALVFGESRLTYGSLDVRANRLARFLRSLGVRRQDRVAILLFSSVESVVSLFGILKADAVFLMLSPTLKTPKLPYILNDCGVKALITHTGKAAVVSASLADASCVERVLWVGEPDSLFAEGFPESVRHHWLEPVLADEAAPGDPPPTAGIDMDLATIIYTSGSTGSPKGVMLTHLNMVSAATSITTYLENRPDDIIFNVLPLSFDYGLYQVLMGFQFGGSVVLERSFTYPYQVIEKMVREKVTGFPGVPTIFAILLGLKNLDRVDFSSLRYITNTAAALPPAHIRQLRSLFPHAKIYSMYGLTECKRVSYLPPEEIDRRPNSVGKGMPNEEVWIVDEAGSRLGAGVTGELVVRGSNVMRGYWGLPEETARVLRPGSYPGEVVLHTGDLFRMDEEGFLYFVGRKDDLIKSRGERISPREIEVCLCALEGVAEAAVVGVPDPVLGQGIVAFLRFHEGAVLTDREVLRHCREHLEDFMVPKTLITMAAFPKTSSGKIDKLELKRLAQDEPSTT